MEIIRCKDAMGLAERADAWVQAKLKYHSAKRMFLPAGRSPEPLYAKWNEAQPDYLRHLTLVQVDDVISGPQKNVFQKFFRHQLSNFSSHFEYIEDAGWRGAELGVLGFGINGHVAFHEPEFLDPFFCACVKLSPSTQELLTVGPNDWCATYGVGAFMQTKSLLILVVGRSKVKSYQRWKSGEHLGATARLRQHQDLTVIELF